MRAVPGSVATTRAKLANNSGALLGLALAFAFHFIFGLWAISGKMILAARVALNRRHLSDLLRKTSKEIQRPQHREQQHEWTTSMEDGSGRLRLAGLPKHRVTPSGTGCKQQPYPSEPDGCARTEGTSNPKEGYVRSSKL